MSRRRTVAMVVNDDAENLTPRIALSSIATVRRLDMLVPTVEGCAIAGEGG